MEYIFPILKTLQNFSNEFISHIPNLIIAIVFLFLSFFIVKLGSRAVTRSMKRFAVQPNLIEVFQKLIVFAMWIICLLIIAAIIFPSVTTANLLATLGLASVAIGFAFKDIFENFLAGILILIREPFRYGDYIVTSHNHAGYVEKISVRNTHIRQSDGVRVVIPNAVLFKNPIQVITDLDLRRIQAPVSVNFSEDIEKVREIIKKVIENCETVSKDKYFQIYVKSYSSNGVDFEIYWWAHSKPSKSRESVNEVLSKIKAAFDKANIILTYSTTISFQDSLTVQKNIPKLRSE